MNITVLCKVVDNYGDIGFVYRLARAMTACITEKLTETAEKPVLRLIVSDLTAFESMAKSITPALAEQELTLTHNGKSLTWQVYDWNAADVCTKAFRALPSLSL